MRVHQAIKNLFIFMPLFFAGQILNSHHLISSLYAFIAFSLGAFAVYIFNDIQDISEDRLHPLKKNRPIASGLVSIEKARMIMFVLVILAIVLMSIISIKALGVLLVYILINMAYSLYLKKIAIVDVSIIATGFILRLLIGSIVTEVHLSLWIISLTFLLALFIALAKRRDDLQIFQKTGNAMRQSILFYNQKLLDYFLLLLAAIISIIYFFYTISPEITSRLHTNSLYISTAFVVLGLARYLHITMIQNNSGSPVTIIYTDRITQAIILAWLIFFTWLIYQ
jgi:4-hydroxybenzoate polyprenyltransferase